MDVQSLIEICKFTYMDKIETIEEFYKRKFDRMPDNIKNEIGHFMVQIYFCAVINTYDYGY
jgi:hypothetical protein